MQVDKITLQDIGLFDNEDHIGLASHLNFCKSNGGEIYLNQFLSGYYVQFRPRQSRAYSKIPIRINGQYLIPVSGQDPTIARAQYFTTSITLAERFNLFNVNGFSRNYWG